MHGIHTVFVGTSEPSEQIHAIANRVDMCPWRARSVTVSYQSVTRLRTLTKSWQLGHSSPSVVLDVYAHLFDSAGHADRTCDALERSFGALLATT